MDIVLRRLELLKLEGLGLSQAEIVKELSQKAGCSARTVYLDFESSAETQTLTSRTAFSSCFFDEGTYILL